MPTSQPFRVADLAQNRSTPFELRPDAAELSALAEELGLLGLRKLSFSGQIAGQGRRDWVLTGQLGATVVQPCVVGEEVEMPEDDTQEQLGSVIDPGQVMVEALALALPLYPRKEGVGSGDASFAGPGITPMTDEEAKPFAGLAALRDSLKKEE